MGDSDEKKKVDNIIVDDEKKKVNPFSEFDNDNGTYKSVEDFLQNQINSVRQESEEDKTKRLRREKRNALIAGIGNVLGSMHKAYSHAAGVEPVNVTSLSDKMQARMERAKAMRQQNKDRLFNYYQNLYKVKDDERNFRFNLAKAKIAEDDKQKAYEDSRADKDRDYLLKDKQVKANIKNAEDRLSETKRVNNTRLELQQQGLNLRKQELNNRIQRSEDGKYTEFYTDNGMVRVPKTRLNNHNISYVYNKIPDNKRPARLSEGKPVKLTDEQMMQYIGSNINDPNVQNALRAIGSGSSPKTNSNDNTPPSRRKTNNSSNNTPPSRRR